MLFYFLLLISLFSFSQSLTTEKKIVIFIHGSLSAPEGYTNPDEAKGSWKGLYRQLSEQLNTEKSINNNYENNFFTRKNRGKLFDEDKLPLLIGKEPGLHEIKKENLTGITYTNIYEKLNKENTKHYMLNWDGDLSQKSRTFSANMLTDKIKNIVSENIKLADQINDIISEKIKIDLKSHSHGGNVALIAAKKIKVNDIYLLGTPIGKTTEEIISTIPEENYDHIYNIYAINDPVQIKDPFFDLGYLPGRAIKAVNKKIYNIEIKLEDKKKYIKHEDFFMFNKEKPYSPLIVPLQNFREKFIAISNKEENKEINNYIATLKNNNTELDIIPNRENIDSLFFHPFFEVKKSKDKLYSQIRSFYQKFKNILFLKNKGHEN